MNKASTRPTSTSILGSSSQEINDADAEKPNLVGGASRLQGNHAIQHQGPIGESVLSMGKSGDGSSCHGNKLIKGVHDFQPEKVMILTPTHDIDQKAEESETISEDDSDDNIERNRYGQKATALDVGGHDESSNDSDDEDDNGMEELLLLDDANQENLDEQDMAEYEKK